ncbi:MAG: cellulase N-terminal Ig-like domain-containing protein [Planctomycetota bacterium]
MRRPAVKPASGQGGEQTPDAAARSPVARGLAAECPFDEADLNLGPRDRYPFRMDFSFPKYEGLDAPGHMDLQVVHGRLVIVGNDYTMQARERAYERRKAQLDAIRDQGGNAWVRYKKHAALLRESFIETYKEHEKLDDPAFFAISSANDPAYREGRPPEKVTRWCTSRGNLREFHIARGREVTAGNYLANFSYVTLPEPMKTGGVYRISQADGRKVTFAFHEDHTVNRAIKVNQTGYLPRAGRKYAYLGGWRGGMGPIRFDEWEGRPFEVVDADTRRVVHTGRVARLARDPRNRIGKREQASAGEDVYELDLSGLEARGEEGDDLYIRIRGVGRSWPFVHGRRAYGRAFYVHLRGLYHQRGGHELDPAHTAWPRPLAHAQAFLADYVPAL